SAGGKGGSDNRMLTLSNMTEATLADMSESSSKYEFLSFFGRVDYGLMDRYFADFTIRNDKSSRFGAKNRSAWFLSGNVMWKMKEEAFLKEVWWLDDLDLRVAVGSTGNAGIGNYASLGLIGDTQYGGVPGWAIAQPSNERLGWEKQIQSNIGITASFLKKLTVDFNLYEKRTKNMLMTIPLPYTTGFGSQMMNVGELSNRGFEVEVKYDVLRHRDYYLQVRANYSYNKNKIEKLFYGLEEWPMESYLLNYVVGKSLNYYMPIYAGVDKEDGAPMWYKVGYKGGAGHVFNPETMTKDASQIESLYQVTNKPRYAPSTGGFGLTANWKGITLNADFAFILGKYMVNNTYLWATSRSNMTNLYNGDRDMLNIWKNPGDLADLPAFRYDSEFDTHLLENASFLRLKNLTLAYDLPKAWMEETGFMKNVRLSFITRNLFTVTKFRGADPEPDSNITYGNYPATRQFVLGVEVTF
ncbi:MAG: TonB-dependent receptor, partial [Alloprevotella sp.]|nr:TonB-dependent receptor [Alloprevotella sp.]